jgi:hypothetical protein
MNRVKKSLGFLIFMFILSCASDRPFLTGFIRRATDAILIPCDPYNQGKEHSCVVYASEFNQRLLVYDATAEEMVLSRIGYFPLFIAVGPTTDELTPVLSADKKFPFFLALDSGEKSLYIVSSFPQGSKQSFQTPTKLSLTENYSHMAAFDDGQRIVLFLSKPDSGEVVIKALKRSDGSFDKTFQKISVKVGVSPSHVAIDDERKHVIVTDEGGKNIYVFDTENLNKAPTAIAINSPSNVISLAKRDFGAGEKLYALLKSAAEKKVILANISDAKREYSIDIDSFPAAVYLPDLGSKSCCSGEKNWFAVADIKGNLLRYSARAENPFKIEKLATIDMTSIKNLNLETFFVKKIIGGKILSDASLDQKPVCPSERRMFFVAAYGSSKRSELITESYEVEAQAYACEGEDGLSRLGLIKDE